MTAPITPPIALLRSLQRLAMPDTAAISRYVETNTPDGVEQAWQTIASGIPCRADAHAAFAAERPGGGDGALVRAVSHWRVHLPALTDVTERDRIAVTSTETGAVRTFEATSVRAVSYETVRDVLCTLVS